ncbi:ribonuclease R [Falsiporphyromonas endometrii]|uniref:Ribonuclease R n=1 Tax=Falsiporphyromonas endometrii TaxID=1387297 RepID=A0ABV9K6X0_9PORP
MKKKRNITSKKKVSGSKKKANRRAHQMTRRQLTENILSTFAKRPGEILNYKQISRDLNISSAALRQQVFSIMQDLAFDHLLLEVDRGRFKYNALGHIIEGVFQRDHRGNNKLLPDDGSTPIDIADCNSNHALTGDRVRAQLFAKRKGKNLEAEIIQIVERKDQQLVGVIEVSPSYAFFVTDDKKVGTDVFIPKEELNGAKDNDKVICKITDWPSNAKNPLGRVIAVLGPQGDNNAEMHAILAQYGLPYKYPENVEKEADKLSLDLTKEVLKGREDFRKVTTFTIDPADAKDFDDALSFEKMGENKYQIGVHIADVSHYVTPKSVIDEEAFSRGNSIYLVDRTIPMLPEKLCNDLCSLKPNVDRLAYSCIFTMNDEAKILEYHITRTIINSDRRFSYEEAQQVIETGEGDLKEEILKLNQLAQTLRDKRFKNGAIGFESQEVKFKLDEKGKPIGVYIKESKEANHLIEEFMLLANRTVATHIGKVKDKRTKPKTFVYRIHEQPDQDKMLNLRDFIGKFGYKLKTSGSNLEISDSFNKLLSDVHGKKEETLISTIAIRSMAKARYSTENIGHYGLAFDYYTHFTSPIRRYPDLMVHRLLTEYLNGGKSQNQEKYEEACKHCSETELIAAQAERDSIKYKQVEYMQSYLGKVFDGIISGVAEWGLYVELSESHCEGLVPMRSLDNDFYIYDEQNYCLIGRRTKQRYTIGDKVTVKLAAANLERRQIDFELV